MPLLPFRQCGTFLSIFCCFLFSFRFVLQSQWIKMCRSDAADLSLVKKRKTKNEMIKEETGITEYLNSSIYPHKKLLIKPIINKIKAIFHTHIDSLFLFLSHSLILFFSLANLTTKIIYSSFPFIFLKKRYLIIILLWLHRICMWHIHVQTHTIIWHVCIRARLFS